MNSAWATWWMLGVGIIVGAVLSIVFHRDPIAYAWKLTASNEYYTEPEAAEKGMFDETREASTTTAETTSGVPFVVGVATASSSPRSLRVPVMIYHSVRPYQKGESKYQDAYDITPELLEEELLYIKANGFHTVTFHAVAEYFANGTPLPGKPVILSFDDGWKNQYIYAFPLLKKYGMTGTFFIFSNPIDSHKPHWMSWAEVVELGRAGMEIGGHSRTHPILTKIVDDALLDKEISGSKKIIEGHLGHPMLAFAYPFGAENGETEQAVTRAGYTIARTVYSGVWNDPEHRLVFHGTLSSDNIRDFERLLAKQ